ncbi:hypothetical protein [Kitasatospora sp. NPDC057015]|uniref:hypothetical protein n=1 Tax=Kitasatospora sp. NPDC057015 TaxID=3346001 RepID=UPI00363884EB
MRREVGRRWPGIARELARAGQAAAGARPVGTGSDGTGSDGTGSAALLDAVERMIPPEGPRTLPEVLAPVRAYLLAALGADRRFEGACVFAGEIAAAGQLPVRVRVELLALGPEDARRVQSPHRRPPLREAGPAELSPARRRPGAG